MRFSVSMWTSFYVGGGSGAVRPLEARESSLSSNKTRLRCTHRKPRLALVKIFSSRSDFFYCFFPLFIFVDVVFVIVLYKQRSKGCDV